MVFNKQTPYEPLVEAFLVFWRKTFFLITLARAERMNELNAHLFEESHVQ